MNKQQATIEQFHQTLIRLQDALAQEPNEFMRDSAIQRFEFTFDLAWKSIKNYLLESLGIQCASPKKCLQEAFAQNLINDENAWLLMVDMRNETVHTYHEETAQKVYAQLPAFVIQFDNLFNAFKTEDRDGVVKP